MGAFGVLGMLHASCLDPSIQQLVQLMFMSCVYLSHHLVLTNRLTLNKTNLKLIYVVFYASFIPFVFANPNGDDGRAIITQGFNTSSRMIMSVVFMDTSTAAPAQLAISLAEIGVHWMRHASADMVLFAWMQTLVGCSIIGISAFLEFWVTSHISVLLDTECMVSSFRRMLRGVCDGEVMLNEDMEVCEDAVCLKHLLMTQGNFKGKGFQKLLVPEESGRFQEFLKQSMADAQKAEEERTMTPPCLRISLRGASDIRVGVDLWHVLMPGRKDGMLHLLALREDSEARAAPPSTTNVNQKISQEPASPTSTVADDSFDREPSESSYMSQKSSASFLQNFPELVNMTLCVDATTHWFDVEQAHLSFQRQPQSSDSSMPSLRRLVRPTDWETVRSKLKEIADQADGSMDLRLRLVDDAKRSMIAQGHVSTYKPPRGHEDGVKLCLQLTEMLFEDKNSRDWNLAAISE